MTSELSDTEFQHQIKSLAQTDLSPEHFEELNTFLKLSSDFTNFFTSCTLNDFRNLRSSKPMNLIFLMSHVSIFIEMGVFVCLSIKMFFMMIKQVQSDKIIR